MYWKCTAIRSIYPLPQGQLLRVYLTFILSDQIRSYYISSSHTRLSLAG